LSPEDPPSASALPHSDPENPPSASEKPHSAPNTSEEEEVKSYRDSSQESDNPAPPPQPDIPSPEEVDSDEINRAVRFINEARDSGSTSIWVYPGLLERVQKGRVGQKPAYTCMLPSNRGVCTSDPVSWDKEPSLCYEAEEHDASTIERNLGILVEVLKLR
jgi:histone deacetylase complex regulatory component SIN3